MNYGFKRWDSSDPAPILAIPGNHDGVVYKGETDDQGK